MFDTIMEYFKNILIKYKYLVIILLLINIYFYIKNIILYIK